MTVELTVAISVACSLLGAVIGYATYRRNAAKDITDDSRTNGTILSDIGYIKAGIDEIKHKQERQDEQHLEVIARLTAVEASSKQAHHRIGRIEGKAER